MVSSRIQVEALNADAHPDREIWVGWDHGMQSFYAQVFDGVDGDGEDVVIVNAGNLVSEFTHPDDLLPVLQDYATLPDDVVEQLIADRDADIASQDLSSEPGDVARRALLGDPDATEMLLRRRYDDGLEPDSSAETEQYGYGSSL